MHIYYAILCALMESDAQTTIRISQAVREQLKEMGKKGATYDSILTDVLRKVEVQK